MKKILVVDDEAAIGRVLCKALSENYDVMYAPSAESGLGFLQEGGYALVLMDIDMPGRSGLQAIGDMKALIPSIRIVMMTGSRTEADRAWILSHGAHDFIPKPFTLGALQDVVERQMGRHGSIFACRLLGQEPCAVTDRD